MDIVKNLKDYRFTSRQRIFAGYIKENLGSSSCREEITNKDYLRRYFSPENDFTIYTTAIADPKRLIRKERA